MADQGHWFKLWCSAIDDPSLSNLPNEKFAIWAKLGAYTKKHGNGGELRIEAPARALCAILQVVDFEELCVTVGQLPNVKIVVAQGSANGVVTGVTNATVTFSKWMYYQGDNSAHRVRKYRENVTDKKRREEKRVNPPPKGSSGSENVLHGTGGLKDEQEEENSTGETEASGVNQAWPAKVSVEWKSADWGTVVGWVAMYNELAPRSWMSIRVVERKRAGLIAAALKDFPDEKYWREVLRNLGRNAYLSGAGEPPKVLGESNRHPDWLLSEGRDGVLNHVKVFEGRLI